MLNEKLTEKDYLPILTMENGDTVTKENWHKRREEIKNLLEKYSYGKTPDIPVKVYGSVEERNDNAYGGKLWYEKININIKTEKGTFTFPMEFYIPKKVNKPPVFLHIAFRPVPDRYIPVEEITDGGFALGVVVYKDVVNDNLKGDYSDGLAEYFGTTQNRKDDQWGKIGMWAYALSRVMDYITNSRTDLDSAKVAVIGHSRLGKTAMWCGALDERFAAVISNNSGYGGAASSKHGKGERINDFLYWGSWDWFCENFKKFKDSEDEKPYDQSFLSAMIAPRFLCVGSAIEDKGADPEAEFLTTLHASKVWEVLGTDGLICPDRMPVPGDDFFEGNVGYHLRDNGHFLSREDWNAYIKFLKMKFNIKGM